MVDQQCYNLRKTVRGFRRFSSCFHNNSDTGNSDTATGPDGSATMTAVPGTSTGQVAQGTIAHHYSVIDVKYPHFKGDIADLESWFKNAENLARSKSNAVPTDLMYITAANNLIDHKDVGCVAAQYATFAEIADISVWDQYKKAWRLACSTQVRTDLYGMMLQCLNTEPNASESTQCYNARVDKSCRRLGATLENSGWLDVTEGNKSGISVAALIKLFEISLFARKMSPEVRQKVFKENISAATSTVEFISFVQNNGGFLEAPTVCAVVSKDSQPSVPSVGAKPKKKGQKKGKTGSVPSVNPSGVCAQPTSASPQSSSKIVCHHCGVPGHIRPKCKLLKQVQVKPAGKQPYVAQQTPKKFCSVHPKSDNHDTSECRNLRAAPGGNAQMMPNPTPLPQVYSAQSLGTNNQPQQNPP